MQWQISHRCETYELQRFPLLRRRIEEVMANFLREGLAPAETMIGHLIEMEVHCLSLMVQSLVLTCFSAS
jgi:hypothetical protein